MSLATTWKVPRRTDGEIGASPIVSTEPRGSNDVARPFLSLTLEVPMNWQQLALLTAAVLFVTPTPPPMDLDMGIPPGTPASWGRRFPSITPRNGPLFPITPGGKNDKLPGVDGGKKVKNSRATVVMPATVKMDVNISTSFGVVRILTWDLAGHLTWVSRTPRSTGGPVTGPSGKNITLPYVTDGLYWANMASLLRLMMHPQLVSEKELIVHLVEIGEPLIEVLDNSVSEKSLVPASKKIRKMVTAPTGDAGPLPGKTPRETMMKRFLAEELATTYPYDPEGGFGQRFYLFSDEVEPYLIEYAQKHTGSFVRRNAVSAVGRYRSDRAMTALGQLAATTKDPVVLMRSLAAVGAYTSLRDRAPLLERMTSTKNPIERIAFVVASGRMRMREAVPFLVKQGGSTKDPDLIQAVVAALCRIDHPPGHPAVSKFARRIAKSAGTRPERFRVKFGIAPKADLPDTAATRGIVIYQLALLLQVRLNGKERATAAKRVLGYISKPGVARGGRRRGGAGRAPGGPAGRRIPRRRSGYANTSMRSVLPPVQLLFLETLRTLGAEGVKGLERIASDPTVDPVLRGHAMSQLPWSSRGKVATDILDEGIERMKASRPKRSGPAPDLEAMIYAIEVVANDGHGRLEEIARGLLTECAEDLKNRKKSGAAATPSIRYLWLQAIRALDKRSLLKTDELLALMELPKTRKVEDATLKQRVRNLIEAFVSDSASRLGPKATLKRIDEILDFIRDAGFNPSLAERPRKEIKLEILKRLAGLKGHRSDTRFKTMVTRDLLTYLTGFTMGMGLREQTRFRPVVVLEEEILLALGRTKTKRACKALVAFLKDHPDTPLRAHAALALGMAQKLEYARHLVPVLKDMDGFTRFCAYESLRHLTNRDIWADWMYGDSTVRNLAADHYRKLVGK